ncbi:hypothetical protein N7468_002601 [Penicillium chermesinum]|uniref:Uncharacterized protein n=1 Tax=Penicillium chermesinum TaxID=63820 RepID=A0A9W9PKY1_9EURO|nr:uncharacterized protein N7468_002601 [Penicillium chermesinum]KAJ5247618.1 hypothetical protein N7468_002601 [Penicillium chermesinum]
MARSCEMNQEGAGRTVGSGPNLGGQGMQLMSSTGDAGYHQKAQGFRVIKVQYRDQLLAGVSGQKRAAWKTPPALN